MSEPGGEYPSAPPAPPSLYSSSGSSYDPWKPSDPNLSYSPTPPLPLPALSYRQSSHSFPQTAAATATTTDLPYGAAPPGEPSYYAAQAQRPEPRWSDSPPRPQYGYGGQEPLAYGEFSGSRVEFLPGTDPELVRSFQMADPDGTGFIHDYDLVRVLAVGPPLSFRTIRLMLLLFTSSDSSKIGPIEFVTLWKALKQWRGIFDRFDKDNSGLIDSSELREALLSLGFAISPSILEVLLSKYDSIGQGKAIEYDKFVQCGLIVKGLTDRFMEKDTDFTGSATVSYETFMLMVLPFIVA